MFDTGTPETVEMADTTGPVATTRTARRHSRGVVPSVDPVAAARSAITELASEPLAAMAEGVLCDRVRDLACLAERAEAELVRTVGQWNAVEAWAGETPPRLSGRAWLADNTPMSGANASRLVRTARLAHEHDLTGEALAAGVVSVGHLEQLAAVVTHERAEIYPDHEPTLLHHAKNLSVDWYTKALRHWKHLADDQVASDDPYLTYQRRRLHLSATTDMGVLDGRLDLEATALLTAALEAADHPDQTDADHPDSQPSSKPAGDGEHDKRTGAQRRADALVELARAYLDGRHAQSHAEILFHIDPHTYAALTEDTTTRGTTTRDLHNNHTAAATNPTSTEPTPTSTPTSASQSHIAENASEQSSDRPAPQPHIAENASEQSSDRPAPQSHIAENASEHPSDRPAHRPGLPPSDEPPPDAYRSICELDGYGPVPPDTVRRACCTAALRRVIFDARGEILDLGRRVRLASPAQRRAVNVRDHHCVFPGCDRPARWCDVHHLTPWEHGGDTDLDNLCLLCRHHHVLAHEGHWRLSRQTGIWTANPPDQTPRDHDPPTNQRA